MTSSQHPRLDAIARKAARRSDTSDVRFAVRRPSTGLDWSWRDEDAPEPYFIASITKLFTTTIALQHIDEGRYALSTPARDLLPPGTLDGLLPEPSAQLLTVEHLLSHTSGIPDYFEQPRPDGTVLIDELAGADAGWSPSEALAMVRGATPLAVPGAEPRARYSDTNFQLLGMIIEATDGTAYASAVERRIAAPLGLAHTYIFSDATADRFGGIARVHLDDAPFAGPLAMASFGPDGGAVSTTADQLTFLEAFVAGDLFPPALLAAATARWHRMFFPLQYGIGLMRYSLPRAMNPFSPQPPMIGHSGASGAVLFYAPDRDMFVAGTVNQLTNRGLVYRVMSRLVQAAS